jgi:tetratricopeptide (TPR) repeat protein
MRKDSLAFALSGTVFGLLVGWMIGTQQVREPDAPAPAAAPAAQAAPAQPNTPPPLDQARATALEQQAKAEPRNAGVRVDLGNVYFDAERFAEAAPWYEAALEIDPKNVNASTDLAVVYFYQGQMDRALAQLDRALAVDPRHPKALLNQGIIRAFGKQDLVGAEESWKKVVEIAPDSPEGQRAQQGLDGLRSAHNAAQAGAQGGAAAGQ